MFPILDVTFDTTIRDIQKISWVEKIHYRLKISIEKIAQGLISWRERSVRVFGAPLCGRDGEWHVLSHNVR